MSHTQQLGFSVRARQLGTWIASRTNPTQAFQNAEVPTVIGSRRHAQATILELQNAGFLQVVSNFLLPNPSILEFTSQCVGSAGLDVEPAVVHDIPAATLCPSGQTGTPSALNLSAQPEDLRLRQRSLVLGSARSAVGRQPRVSSFPEGEALETTNSGISNTNHNKDIINKYSSAPARVMGHGPAPANPKTGLGEPKNSRRIYADSRIDTSVYTDSGKRIYNQDDAKPVVYTTKSDKQSLAKERAKRVAASHTTAAPLTLSLSAETSAAAAYGVAVAYEELLGIYLGKPTLRYLKGRVAPGQPNFSNWSRAAAVADELGLDYAMFVRSQFWAFDAWYNRAPKPQELGSRTSAQSSAERARQFLDAVTAGTVNANKNILGKQREIVDTTTPRGRAAVKVPQSTKFQHSEHQLRTLMKNFEADEEQVLRTFAKGATASVYFDRVWLQQNPTYQRLVAAGEI